MAAAAGRISSRALATAPGRRMVVEASKKVAEGAKKVASSVGKSSSSNEGPRVIVVSEKELQRICDRNFERQINESAQRVQAEATKTEKPPIVPTQGG